jgi:hypothetical protein
MNDVFLMRGFEAFRDLAREVGRFVDRDGAAR